MNNDLFIFYDSIQLLGCIHQ